MKTGWSQKKKRSENKKYLLYWRCLECGNYFYSDSFLSYCPKCHSGKIIIVWYESKEYEFERAII